jgi:hypothetical protein
MDPPPGTAVERRVADAAHRMRQIRELRHRGWGGDKSGLCGDDLDGSDLDGSDLDGSDLGGVLARYEEYLFEAGLADGPGLLRRALEAVRGGLAPELEETVLILLPALTTRPDESEYVDALRESVGASCELGEPADAARWTTAPETLYRSVEEAQGDDKQDPGYRPGLAARVLRGKSPGSQDEGPSVRPIQAATPETEVSYVLRAIKEGDLIKERRLQFDEVEVAYVPSDPYLDLWVQAARRLRRQSDAGRLPVTFGGGIPPRQTHAGRVLLDYFMLVEEGPEAPILAQMLRNGTLRPPGEETRPQKAASIFSKIRPAPTREGYRGALKTLADDPYSLLEGATSSLPARSSTIFPGPQPPQQG